MNLLLVEPDEVRGEGADARVEVVGDRARHLRETLRVEAGSTVRAGIVDGPRGRATVVSVTDRHVTVRLDALDDVPPFPAVDLLLALPRPKVLKRLYAPLASMGVGAVVLTGAERVERYYFDSHAVRPEVYRPRLVEGLAQARDTRLPRVSLHRHLGRALSSLGDPPSHALRLVADVPVDQPLPSPRAVCAGARGRVLVAIGPEGGWVDREREQLAAHGFASVGLGERPLRTDVATVALLALVHEGLRKA